MPELSPCRVVGGRDEGKVGGGQGEDQVMEEASATDRDQEAERERRLGILTVWASSF